MVEPARFALTSKPSIGPSSAEVTLPESACAIAGGTARQTPASKPKNPQIDPRIVASKNGWRIPLLNAGRRNGMASLHFVMTGLPADPCSLARWALRYRELDCLSPACRSTQIVDLQARTPDRARTPRLRAAETEWPSIIISSSPEQGELAPVFSFVISRPPGSIRFCLVRARRPFGVRRPERDLRITPWRGAISRSARMW